MSLGQNLVFLRKNAGMSQDDVSQALGMTRPAYKQLEGDERSPSNSEMLAVSELYGVRVESLLEPISQAQDRQTGLSESTLNKLKYKNVILYLAEKIGARPNVGETVFYKLIYFTETLALSRNGKGITNESFYKMQYGPVPVSFSSVTQEMINANELDRVTGKYFTYMQTKYLPRVESMGLSDEEKRLIDEIIVILGDKTATELSDLSHKDRPWIDAEMGSKLDLDLTKETSDHYSSLMGRIPVSVNF